MYGLYIRPEKNVNREFNKIEKKINNIEVQFVFFAEKKNFPRMEPVYGSRTRRRMIVPVDLV